MPAGPEHVNEAVSGNLLGHAFRCGVESGRLLDQYGLHQVLNAVKVGGAKRIGVYLSHLGRNPHRDTTNNRDVS